MTNSNDNRDVVLQLKVILKLIIWNSNYDGMFQRCLFLYLPLSLQTFLFNQQHALCSSSPGKHTDIYEAAVSICVGNRICEVGTIYFPVFSNTMLSSCNLYENKFLAVPVNRSKKHYYNVDHF